MILPPEERRVVNADSAFLVGMTLSLETCLILKLKHKDAEYRQVYQQIQSFLLQAHLIGFESLQRKKNFLIQIVTSCV